MTMKAQPGGDELADLVAAARRGDSEALEQLISAVQDDVYRLGIRMVWHPAEAEDATQEILLKAITRLANFRGEAAFRTWLHRIAVNHLIDRKRSRAERRELSFDEYGRDLADGLSEPNSYPDPEQELLAEEVRLGCTLAMLNCLDRDHRVAYVLGEIFETTTAQGAWICEISETAYRKRLSRARSRVRHFVGEHCGLVAPERASCRCHLRINRGIELGRIDPQNLLFVTHPAGKQAVEAATEDMKQLSSAAELMRRHPSYSAPQGMHERIRGLVSSGSFKILEE